MRYHLGGLLVALTLATLTLAILPRDAHAQGFDQEGAGPGTIELSLSNPGARSLGLGGAFAALADDATAAFANPAGLVQLTRSEVSAEGRQWSYSTPFTVSGRVTGEPTGIGLDSVSGTRTDATDDEVSGLSFLSFVYPKKNWALAFYRHQLANFRSSTATQGLFADGAQPGSVRRFFDRRVATDLEVVSHGVSAAYRVSERLSLGLGLAYTTGRALSTFDLFLVDEVGDFDSFFSPVSFLPEQRAGSLALQFDDTDVIFNLGALWQIAPGWSAGAFYRQAPTYALVQEDFLSGPGLEIAGVPRGTVLQARRVTPIELPDVFGLGLAYRSKDGALTLSVEWDHVEYGTITDSFNPTVIDPEVTLSDADEIHLGAEYVFAHSQPIIAVRLGAWLDPDHLFRFVGGDDSPDDALARALLAGGDDEWHVSAGLGLVLKHIQLDLAIDLSELRDTASLSAIYSF
ncbi:MAG: outer membrane protein transport protein [Acidobacteriota bacterium]